MTRLSLLLFVLACGCANASAPGQGDAGPGSSDGGGSGSAAASGHEAHGFVAGGVVAKSAKYKLIGTLTSGQSTSSSAKFTQHGGVLGSTQK